MITTANIKNLKRLTSKQAREYGRRGGIASAKKKKERKTLKQELLLLLSEKDTQKKISVALIKKASNGDIAAFSTIRDTIGEKPTNKVDLSGQLSYEKMIKKVIDNDEY